MTVQDVAQLSPGELRRRQSQAVGGATTAMGALWASVRDARKAVREFREAMLAAGIDSEELDATEDQD